MRPLFVLTMQTVFSSYLEAFNELRAMSTADVVVLTFTAVVKFNMLCITDYLNTED